MRKMHELKIPDNRKTAGAFIQLVYTSTGYKYNPKEAELVKALKAGDLVFIDIYSPDDDYHNYAIGFVESGDYREFIISPLGSLTIQDQDGNDERIFYIALRFNESSGSAMNKFYEQIDDVIIDTEINIYKL